MNKRHVIIVFFLLFLSLGMLLSNSNYEFQVIKVDVGDSVPLGPVDFSSPAADTYQYIDATSSTTYGTVTNGPPLGMGVDSDGPTGDTELLEESYVYLDYTQLEYASFSAGLPSLWNKIEFTFSGGSVISNVVSSTRGLYTKSYDLGAYTGARITYQHRAYDFQENEYETGDWEIWYIGSSGTTKLADVSYSAPYGAWKSGDHSVASTYSLFSFYMIDGGATQYERIDTDNWYIYGYASENYYRFEAIFRFDSVTLSLGSYVMYVDFYSALSGSEDLDFYIGTTTNPTNLVAVDKQNDFTVIVTDYITSGSIYLKISDNYRTGDTSQSTAYIQRIYLFSPEAGWFDEEWPRRQLVTINGSTGAGTDYQVNLTVPYDSNMKSDFGDLRVTDNDGITPLAYWIEEYTASTSAIVWVKMLDSLESANTFYMYYGNSVASTTSNGTATFIAFDDFENNDLLRWDTAQSDWSTQAGTVKMGTYAAYGDSGAGRGLQQEVNLGSGVGFAVHTWYRAAEIGTYHKYPVHGYNTTNIGMILTYSNDWIYWNGGAQTWELNTVAATTWYEIDMGFIFSGDMYLWLDGVSKGTKPFVDYSNNPVTALSEIGSLTNGATGKDQWIDDYYVRQWVISEPVFDSYGDEEIGDFSAPTIASTSYSPLVPTTATGLTLFAIVTDIVGVDDVWFDAIAYPDGFEDIPYHAEEIGTNTWSYSFNDLSDGIYCFITYALDSVNDPTVADYTQYQTIQVSEGQITGYIRIFDSLGAWIPFETFEIYLDGDRQYTDTFYGDSDTQHDILVKDRWGVTLNYTMFSAGTEEFVVTVDVYSLKVMSWYSDFCYFNITHDALTYVEVIAPMETVSFRLFTGSYTIGVNYRNGSGWFSYEVNLVNSTALVISGSTIADVAALSAQILGLSVDINVTLYSTTNQILTISIDLDNINTTINTQLIQVLLDISNTNTTVYQQTVDVLAAIQNTNTTIYNQLVQVLIDIDNVNATLYTQTVTLLTNIANLDSDIVAQTISLLASIENVNSTIYAQTVTLLANIANLDSDIVAQTVTLLADIQNVNTTLYSQTVTMLAEISNLGSDITTQTVTLLASISNVNSTIYAQTVSLLAEISNLNSTVTTQTITLMTAISNMNTTIYGQTVTLLTEIRNFNSTIYGQSVENLLAIYNVNSTLYTQLLKNLEEVDDIEEKADEIQDTADTIKKQGQSSSSTQTLGELILLAGVIGGSIFLGWTIEYIRRGAREDELILANLGNKGV